MGRKGYHRCAAGVGLPRGEPGVGVRWGTQASRVGGKEFGEARQRHHVVLTVLRKLESVDLEGEIVDRVVTIHSSTYSSRHLSAEGAVLIHQPLHGQESSWGGVGWSAV